LKSENKKEFEARVILVKEDNIPQGQTPDDPFVDPWGRRTSVEMNWYVVNTLTRQEETAEQSLERLGVETFFPRIMEERIIRRKRSRVISPLFPGYLFVRFNMETHYRAVQYARGVRGLVAFGERPALIDEAIIESIKLRLHGGYVTVQPPLFRSGEIVRINKGPLQGFEAAFEREMSAQQRVVLLLQMLSCQARLVVDLEQVV